LIGLVIADAGPLIGLSRIGRLNLLHRLYGTVLMPPAVEAELCLAEPRPGVAPLIEAVTDGWLEVAPPSPSADLLKLKLLLDAGEAEALELANQRGCRFVLMDDRRGRNIARHWNIPIAGTGAVLLAAKSGGLIHAVAPAIEELGAARYRLGPGLIAALLRKAGEG
jgi:predicted nucleic acid-binding protein